MKENSTMMLKMSSALDATMGMIRQGHDYHSYTQSLIQQNTQNTQQYREWEANNARRSNNPFGSNQRQPERQSQVPNPQQSVARFQLKPEMVGLFEPSSMEDSTAAKVFMDAIDDSVANDGEELTLGVLRRCVRGDIATSWRTSLCEDDKVRMRTSTTAWKEILDRDFFPRKAIRLLTARKEVFKWNQGRKPLEYATEKARLLRIAGVRDEDEIVEQIHAGFVGTPELFSSLENCIKPGGQNTVSDYRAHISRHQDAARASHDLRTGAYRYSNNAKGGYTGKTADSKETLSTDKSKPFDASAKNGNKPRSSDFKRARPCRWCQGEHWDYECDKRTKGERPKVKAYYAHMGRYDITTDLLFEMEENDQMEEEYEEAQRGYFAGKYIEENTTARAFYASPTRKRDIVWSCDTCDLEYPTRSKLYIHMSTANHMGGPARTIESDAPKSSDPTADLSKYHFAQGKMRTCEDGVEQTACIDCGYGNSAVDAKYLRTIKDVVFLPLPKPVSVEGIGGGLVTTTKVAMLHVFMKTLCGYTVKLTRPFHIFPDLGIPMLIGNDIMQPERMTVSYSEDPTLIIGSCKNKKIRLKIMDQPELKGKTACKTTSTLTIAPSHTALAPIRVMKEGVRTSCYLLTPSRTRSAQAGGCGVPHTFIRYDQSVVPITNFTDHPVTIYKGTVVGSVRVCNDKRVEWKEASEEVSEGLLGAQGPQTKKGYFAGDTADAGKEWSPPPWLKEDYVPQYEHPIPEKIKVPSVETSTYASVCVNTDDDILPHQTQALRDLAARHKHLFNDEKGCVREPKTD